MATRRAPRTKGNHAAAPSSEDLGLELAALRERLRSEGAVKLSGVVPKAARGELCARLCAEGFELAGTWLRRPLREQIRDALGHGANLTKPALAGLVRGASRPELARVTSELEEGGEVFRVLRGKSETFTGTRAEVLSAPSLAALKAWIAELTKASATLSKKKGMTLLASDVDAWLGAGRSLLDRNSAGTARQNRPAAPSVGHPSALLDALDATREEPTGLSFVPRVVERLLPSVSLAVAHDMLLQAARDERIELRPEGGLGRLTSAELGLCPAGPGGTRLSWARRLDGAA